MQVLWWLLRCNVLVTSWLLFSSFWGLNCNSSIWSCDLNNLWLIKGLIRSAVPFDDRLSHFLRRLIQFVVRSFGAWVSRWHQSCQQCGIECVWCYRCYVWMSYFSLWYTCELPWLADLLCLFSWSSLPKVTRCVLEGCQVFWQCSFHWDYILGQKDFDSDLLNFSIDDLRGVASHARGSFEGATLLARARIADCRSVILTLIIY